MQVASRRLSRALRRPPTLLCSDHGLQMAQHRNHSLLCISGIHHGACMFSSLNDAWSLSQNQACLLTTKIMPTSLYSTMTNADEGTPTEAVKELYDKMYKSIAEQRTMPPNAWLWSLIENCANQYDIKLLFEILKGLRVFRLSHLRIHTDFNCHLCSEITKACTRVGAIDLGVKALWKHNVYGLSPTIGSAHHLLLYAKEHNNAKLMVEIMTLMKRNDLPVQPGTADIVLSICSNTNNWELMSKYTKRFTKDGVKLRQTSFDLWMDFAAKRGDVDAIWRIEKLRSESMKRHTVVSAFSCAKGFLLESKPEEAAALIQGVNQTLSDSKRPGIMVELQKLISEWPFEVIKHQKEEDRKTMASALRNGIPSMVSRLMNLGLEVTVDMEDLKKEGLLG